MDICFWLASHQEMPTFHRLATVVVRPCAETTNC